MCCFLVVFFFNLFAYGGFYVYVFGLWGFCLFGLFGFNIDLKSTFKQQRDLYPSGCCCAVIILWQTHYLMAKFRPLPTAQGSLLLWSL